MVRDIPGKGVNDSQIESGRRSCRPEVKSGPLQTCFWDGFLWIERQRPPDKSYVIVGKNAGEE